MQLQAAILGLFVAKYQALGWRLHSVQLGFAASWTIEK